MPQLSTGLSSWAFHISFQQNLRTANLLATPSQASDDFVQLGSFGLTQSDDVSFLYKAPARFIQSRL